MLTIYATYEGTDYQVAPFLFADSSRHVNGEVVTSAIAGLQVVSSPGQYRIAPNSTISNIIIERASGYPYESTLPIATDGELFIPGLDLTYNAAMLYYFYQDIDIGGFWLADEYRFIEMFDFELLTPGSYSDVKTVTVKNTSGSTKTMTCAVLNKASLLTGFNSPIKSFYQDGFLNPVCEDESTVHTITFASDIMTEAFSATYVSESSLAVYGDLRSTFPVGTRVSVICGSTTVNSVVYDSDIYGVYGEYTLVSLTTDELTVDCEEVGVYGFGVLIDGVSIDIVDTTDDTVYVGGVGLTPDGTTVYSFRDESEYRGICFVLATDLEESDTATFRISPGSTVWSIRKNSEVAWTTGGATLSLGEFDNNEELDLDLEALVPIGTNSSFAIIEGILQFSDEIGTIFSVGLSCLPGSYGDGDVVPDDTGESGAPLFIRGFFTSSTVQSKLAEFGITRAS